MTDNSEMTPKLLFPIAQLGMEIEAKKAGI